jgi:hypothetical protein
MFPEPDGSGYFLSGLPALSLSRGCRGKLKLELQRLELQR